MSLNTNLTKGIDPEAGRFYWISDCDMSRNTLRKTKLGKHSESKSQPVLQVFQLFVFVRKSRRRRSLIMNEGKGGSSAGMLLLDHVG